MVEPQSEPQSAIFGSFFQRPGIAGRFPHNPASSIFDDQYLEKTLEDNSHFINAEMLLKENFHLKARQVEGKQLFDVVLDRVVQLENPQNDPAPELPLELQLVKLREEKGLQPS